LFLGSALTISFGLACRDYTFDRSAYPFNPAHRQNFGAGFATLELASRLSLKAVQTIYLFNKSAS